MRAHAGEGDISTLITAVHTHTATSREMLLVQRKQLKMFKALCKEVKQVCKDTASGSIDGTKSIKLTKSMKLTKEQVSGHSWHLHHLTLSHMYWSSMHVVMAAVACKAHLSKTHGNIPFSTTAV